MASRNVSSKLLTPQENDIFFGLVGSKSAVSKDYGDLMNSDLYMFTKVKTTVFLMIVCCFRVNSAVVRSLHACIALPSSLALAIAKYR